MLRVGCRKRSLQRRRHLPHRHLLQHHRPRIHPHRLRDGRSRRPLRKALLQRLQHRKPRLQSHRRAEPRQIPQSPRHQNRRRRPTIALHRRRNAVASNPDRKPPRPSASKSPTRSSTSGTCRYRRPRALSPSKRQTTTTRSRPA